MLFLVPVPAGVAQWQSRSFPSLLRGFDSLRPLQLSSPNSSTDGDFACNGAMWREKVLSFGWTSACRPGRSTRKLDLHFWVF